MHTSTLASLTAVLLGVLGVAEPAHMHTRTNASNQKHFVPNIVYYLQFYIYGELPQKGQPDWPYSRLKVIKENRI
jgi:hypothetical protein